jgi:hypothetical protein
MFPLTKTWVALGFIIIAMLEFWLAMKVFGKKPPSPKAKAFLKTHRVIGYVFLAYLVFLMVIGLRMAGFMSDGYASFDSRVMMHIALAMIIFVVLVLKILFIRAYRQYRPAVPALGIIISGGAVAVWMIAGLVYLVVI